MNKQELNNRIEQLEKELAQLKVMATKPDAVELWVPREHIIYYYTNGSGRIYRTFNENTSNDTYLINHNNIFQTEKQAERHAKRLKLYNKLWRLAEHLNGDWAPDYTEGTQAKYYIVVNNQSFSVNDKYNLNSSVPVFYSFELAQQAIDSLTEEEKRIFANMYRP